MHLILFILLVVGLGGQLGHSGWSGLIGTAYALPQSNATRPVFIPALVQPVKEAPPANPWVAMPEGARKAYIGIHGGTVPVSLLSAGDGTPLIAQVGLTGSDFLNFMRSRGKEKPWNTADLKNVMDMSEHVVQPPVSNTNATLLLAGTSSDDVPVIYATGHNFEKMAIVPANWAHFGLTEKPLSLEGAIKLPPKQEKKPRSRRR